MFFLFRLFFNVVYLMYDFGAEKLTYLIADFHQVISVHRSVEMHVSIAIMMAFVATVTATPVQTNTTPNPQDQTPVTATTDNGVCRLKTTNPYIHNKVRNRVII